MDSIPGSYSGGSVFSQVRQSGGEWIGNYTCDIEIFGDSAAGGTVPGVVCQRVPALYPSALCSGVQRGKTCPAGIPGFLVSPGGPDLQIPVGRPDQDQTVWDGCPEPKVFVPSGKKTKERI